MLILENFTRNEPGATSENLGQTKKIMRLFPEAKFHEFFP